MKAQHFAILKNSKGKEEPEEQEEQVGQVDKDQDLLPTRPQSERIG